LSWTNYLAEHAGDATPDRMQRLLNHAVWDQPLVVAALDESGQEKTGTATAGVKPA
jgi:hypothetical protein